MKTSKEKVPQLSDKEVDILSTYKATYQRLRGVPPKIEVLSRREVLISNVLTVDIPDLVWMEKNLAERAACL